MLAPDPRGVQVITTFLDQYALAFSGPLDELLESLNDPTDAALKDPSDITHIAEINEEEFDSWFAPMQRHIGDLIQLHGFGRTQPMIPSIGNTWIVVRFIGGRGRRRGRFPYTLRHILSYDQTNRLAAWCRRGTDRNLSAQDFTLQLGPGERTTWDASLAATSDVFVATYPSILDHCTVQDERSIRRARITTALLANCDAERPAAAIWP